jgi:ABC-type transporter Mla maintaining outer membrane lipid asymmetry ATPase subunit MlaF
VGKPSVCIKEEEVFMLGTSLFVIHSQELFKQSDRVVTIKKGRIRWAGHVQRMPETRSVKKVSLGKPDGRRRSGRPRKRRLDYLEEDLRKLGVKGWRRKA